LQTFRVESKNSRKDFTRPGKPRRNLRLEGIWSFVRS
jgi:hypothetical protein